MARRYFTEKQVKNRFDEIFAYVSNGDHVIILDEVGIPKCVMIPFDLFTKMEEAMQLVEDLKK